ncbi:hypothetical protein COX95_00015 [bacterium CG_4_10_14_0_2_um_filter_33_32]|nr:MAG: hypothetical protein COZ97_04660 [bacterium CG_4_8_14_3_um_filter_33_28]PIZ86711.1 MAG: hypothetical protein COX95_00015 [bacterium CG_4_10_14_0_2_um_filter_33_32]
MLNKRKKRNTGQSLIEVIIVVGIMTILYTSITNLNSYSIKIGTLNKQKIEAGGVAQQALERIRNIRDTNLKNGYDFDKDINTNTSNKIVSYKDSSNLKKGFKLVPGNEEILGNFKRQTTAEKISDEEIKITATVKWANDKKEIKISNYLTNWKQ